MDDYVSKKKKLEDKSILFVYLLIIPVMFSFFSFIIGSTHQTSEDFIGTWFLVLVFIIVFVANKLNRPFYFISLVCICIQIAGSITALTYEEIIWPIPVLNILSIFFWVKIFKTHSSIKKLENEHFGRSTEKNR